MICEKSSPMIGRGAPAAIANIMPIGSKALSCRVSRQVKSEKYVDLGIMALPNLLNVLFELLPESSHAPGCASSSATGIEEGLSVIESLGSNEGNLGSLLSSGLTTSAIIT